MNEGESSIDKTQKLRAFIRDHFGYDVTQGEFDRLLNDPDVAEVISSSLNNPNRLGVAGVRKEAVSGYNPHDRYYKNKLIKKHQHEPGREYDEPGRPIPHVDKFRQALKELRMENSNTVYSANRTGIKEIIKKKPKQ